MGAISWPIETPFGFSPPSTMSAVNACASKVARNFPVDAVAAALDREMAAYGQPEVITSDNGTEFTSNAFDQWACRRGIELGFIAPGRPMHNAISGSFSEKLRKECLKAHMFESPTEARGKIEVWQRECNWRGAAWPFGGLGAGGIHPRAIARWSLVQSTSQGFNLMSVQRAGGGGSVFLLGELDVQEIRWVLQDCYCRQGKLAGRRLIWPRRVRRRALTTKVCDCRQ